MYEKFAELLASTGVKAADVARATGIIPTTFSDWKKGKSQPKIEKLQKIADYFNVQLEYFTEGAVKVGRLWSCLPRSGSWSVSIALSLLNSRRLRLI